MDSLFSKAYLQKLFGKDYIPEQWGFKKVIYLGEELYMMDIYSRYSVNKALLKIGLIPDLGLTEIFYPIIN